MDAMDADYSVDLRPKTIWGGLTIPGKKMMKLIGQDETARERAIMLLDIYKANPSTTLVGVAQALHFTPKQGMTGPALRDIRKDFSMESMCSYMYGAMLTDIRDFLKLRFRAQGMSPTQALDTAALSRALEQENVGYLINYMIGALDALSKRKIGASDDFEKPVHALRDIATTTARMLCTVDMIRKDLARPDIWKDA